MWCSQIRNTFKKILEENLGYYSKNDYFQMYGKFYDDGKPKHSFIALNYIYCTVCDSLVFLPDRLWRSSGDIHLTSCITKNTESEQREYLLQVISWFKDYIWQEKQNILLYKAAIKCIQLNFHHNPNLSRIQKRINWHW